MRLRSNQNPTKHDFPDLHRKRKPKDPDHALVNSSPPPLIRRTRREYQSILSKGENVAFSYVQPHPDEEDVLFAGMSSAAACIVLELPRGPGNAVNNGNTKQLRRRAKSKRTEQADMSHMQTWHQSRSKDCHRFKPVYTHQFFTEERMRGYRPTSAAESQAMSILPSGRSLHDSFSYHAGARYELSIEIRLAPSCRRSCVVVTVGKVSENNFNMNGVRQALDLSGERTNHEIIEIDDDDGGDYEAPRDRKKRKRSRRANNNYGAIRKSLRLKESQTGSGQGSKRRVNQVSSDESEEHADPIAIRRSGRGRVPSKRSLFPINEFGVISNSVSLDENSRSSNAIKSVSRKRNNHIPSHETPALTRSMSTQSNDSLCASTTGDICLDGGKMRVETIVKHLMRGLPKVDGILMFDGETYTVVREDGNTKSLPSTVKAIDEVDNDYLDDFIGKDIRAYTKRKHPMSLRGSGGIESDSCTGDDEATFVITLADMRDDAKARQYHDEVEKLAPWWIETADCVRMGSTEGLSNKVGERNAHWKVMYLFERHDASPSGPLLRGHIMKPGSYRYSLAGYMTLLFHGKKMVVCQVLILPPYQRSGHGQVLMETAYEKLAWFPRISMTPVSLIDVELPGKAFVSLRDRIDYNSITHVVERLKTPNTPKLPQDCFPSSRNRSLKAFPDDLITFLASKLKITPRQVQIGYEIWLLAEIDAHIRHNLSSLTGVANMNELVTSLEASYKSIVKRSLLQVMRTNKLNERFDSLSIEEQEEKLENYFVSTLCHYRSILSSALQNS